MALYDAGHPGGLFGSHAHAPLFNSGEHDNLGLQYFGGGRQNYAGLESGSGPLASYEYDHDGDLYLERPPHFERPQQPYEERQPTAPARRDHRGLGPKNYQRSDDRICEEVCERLTQDPYVDVSDVSVQVSGGVVTLEGSVDGRLQKYRIEDIAEHCRGVRDIQNRVMVSQRPQ